jgi:nitroreductase
MWSIQRWPRAARCASSRRDQVAPGLLRTLCAAALCAPSKSDVQARDIIIVEDPELLAKIKALLTAGPLAQAWIADMPHLLVFCGNNRRQRLWHEWHGIAFANDHLDAFFNAAVEAGIVLAAFVIAAERAGLGTCPISAIRNHAQAISDLLGLPQHVFPVTGLGVGWPAEKPKLSFRLPLEVTVHTDRYSEDGLREQIATYDQRREAAQPYRQQKNVEEFGRSATYGWSQDKARQYAKPERADFGAFVRRKGFNLE